MWAAVSATAAAGCAGESPCVPAIASPADAEAVGVAAVVPARHPDAVVLEPPAALPVPTTRAVARGVVSLREPVASDAIADLVEAFVDAWERESLDALVALLAPDAGPLESRARGRSALIDAWRQRLHAHEYGRLAGVELVRRERIARWNWGELGAPGAPARPPDMRPDEVYVRLPLEQTRVAGETLFGDSMVMVLRHVEGRLAIAAYGEADAP